MAGISAASNVGRLFFAPTPEELCNFTRPLAKVDGLTFRELESIFPLTEELAHEGKGRLFHCEYCPKQFTRNDNRESHIRRVHRNTNSPFQCSYCGECYKTKTSLQRHFHQRHYNELPVVHSSSIIQQATNQESLRTNKSIKIRRVSSVVNGQNYSTDCQYCGIPCSTAMGRRKHELVHFFPNKSSQTYFPVIPEVPITSQTYGKNVNTGSTLNSFEGEQDRATIVGIPGYVVSSQEPPNKSLPYVSCEGLLANGGVNSRLSRIECIPDNFSEFLSLL